jgi:hypothetical protein
MMRDSAKMRSIGSKLVKKDGEGGDVFDILAYMGRVEEQLSKQAGGDTSGADGDGGGSSSSSSYNNKRRKNRKVERYEEEWDERAFADTWGRLLLAHVEVESNIDIRALWHERILRAAPNVTQEAVRRWNDVRAVYLYPLPAADVDLSDAVAKLPAKDKLSAMSTSKVWSTPYDAGIQDSVVRPLEFLRRRKMEWHEALESLYDGLVAGCTAVAGAQAGEAPTPTTPADATDIPNTVNIPYFYVTGLAKRHGGTTRTAGCLPTSLFQLTSVEGRDGTTSQQQLSCMMMGVTSDFQARLEALGTQLSQVEYSDKSQSSMHASTLDVALRNAAGKHLVVHGAKNMYRVLTCLTEAVFDPVDSQRLSGAVPRLVAPRPFTHGCLCAGPGASSTYSKPGANAHFRVVLGECLMGSSVPALVKVLLALSDTASACASASGCTGSGLPIAVPESGRHYLSGKRGGASTSSFGIGAGASMLSAGEGEGLKNPFSFSTKRTRSETGTVGSSGTLESGKSRKGATSASTASAATAATAAAEEGGGGKRPYFRLKLVHHYRMDEMAYLSSPDVTGAIQEADASGVAARPCSCEDEVVAVQGHGGDVVVVRRHSRHSRRTVRKLMRK